MPSVLTLKLRPKVLPELHLLNPQRRSGLRLQATAECFAAPSHYLSWHFVSKQEICCWSNLLITC